MSFRLVGSADAIEPVMDWIALHKAAWGEERGKRGWFNADDTLALLKSVAKSALNDGRLVLATLSDGNATMSAGWGFVCGGEFLFYAFAYDKAYATYSPSRLFVENLLQHCFRNGIRTFDFMPGDVPYKRIWATDYVREESYIGALNWRGALLLRVCDTRLVSGMPDALRDVYRILPVRLRNAVQRRLRGYRLVNHALHLTLAPTAPPDAVPENGSSTPRHRNAPTEHLSGREGAPQGAAGEPDPELSPSALRHTPT
jgi:CelD/BcsL family acetyltransferase involved in cellulose biosynthesis